MILLWIKYPVVLSLKYALYCFPTNMKVCCKTNICLMTSWLILSPLEVKYYANEESLSSPRSSMGCGVWKYEQWLGSCRWLLVSEKRRKCWRNYGNWNPDTLTNHCFNTSLFMWILDRLYHDTRFLTCNIECFEDEIDFILSQQVSTSSIIN